MHNIPPDRPFSPSPLDPGTYDTTTSKTGKVAQNRFTPTSDSTRSTAFLDINPNSDPSKTTHQVAASILHPKSLSQLLLAIDRPNRRILFPHSSEQTVLYLKTQKSREAFQGIIKQIKNVDALLKIWIELLQKPEEDSLEDVLVDVFQAIYEKNREFSWLAYREFSWLAYSDPGTNQRDKLRKRIADNIQPRDFDYFLEKVHLENDLFSMVLFLKKLYKRDGDTLSDGFKLNQFFFKESSYRNGVKLRGYLNTIQPILWINWDKPYSFKSIHLDHFQQLCVNFCKAEWGTKEEFVTKALCCFWNEIFSSEAPKEALDNLENGILDIGKNQDSALKESTNPLFCLLFSVGTIYPTIQKKIQASEPSPFLLKPEDLERDYANLGPDSKKFIDKIRTLFLPPLEAVKTLEETDLTDKESWPCVRAKNLQFSGSCTVKNFNSLLSMSSTGPSIILHGGFKGHAVYAEVFKSGGQYFALVHNLGAGIQLHKRIGKNRYLPLPLYFKNVDSLNDFCGKCFRLEATEKDYLNLVDQFKKDYDVHINGLKNFYARIRQIILTKEPDPPSFVLSLSSPSKHRSPMYPEYRKFRDSQRKSIRMLNSHGSPSEVKDAASAKRKEQKKGKATGNQWGSFF